MFLLHVVVRMGDSIFCGLVNNCNGVVHGGVLVFGCCERFMLCRYNLGGDEKGGGGGKFCCWLGTLQHNSTLEKNHAK
jgi:hypothetical protein